MYYKLYHRERGYKCKVTLKEINFLFGIQAQTIEEAAGKIMHEMTDYYIKL